MTRNGVLTPFPQMVTPSHLLTYYLGRAPTGPNLTHFSCHHCSLYFVCVCETNVFFQAVDVVDWLSTSISLPTSWFLEDKIVCHLSCVSYAVTC